MPLFVLFLRANEGALVSPKCVACGCKAIRKMDKGVQVQPERNQDHALDADVELHLEHQLWSQHSISLTEFTVYWSLAPCSFCFFTGLSKNVFDELAKALTTVVKSTFAMVFEDQLLLTLMLLLKRNAHYYAPWEELSENCKFCFSY